MEFYNEKFIVSIESITKLISDYTQREASYRARASEHHNHTEEERKTHDCAGCESFCTEEARKCSIYIEQLEILKKDLEDQKKSIDEADEYLANLFYTDEQLAAREAGLLSDLGQICINSAYDYKKFKEKLDKIHSYTDEQLAARVAGLLNDSGQICINSADDYQLFKDKLGEIRNKYTLDDRYINLKQRVEDVNIEQYKKDFVLEIFPICLEIEYNTGVPAEITFGQACTESAYGTKTMVDKYTGQNGNNLFGIKGNGPAGSVECNTHEVVDGINVSIVDDFRAYNSLEESFNDHTELLLRKYKEHAINDTPQAWADALDEVGYATAENYGESILGVARYWRIYE